MSTEQIQVGDLTPRHLGFRVLVTDGESVVDGILEAFWADHTYKREVRLNHLEVKTESGAFKLQQVPVDYVVQIVHPPEAEESDERAVDRG